MPMSLAGALTRWRPACFAADARRARDELIELEPEQFEEWDQGRIPRIRLAGRAGPHAAEDP